MAQPPQPPQPPRTGNSLIFGVPARLTSSRIPRFDWTAADKNTFENWIHTNPEGGYDNLSVLLQGLDLDGFTDDILNAEGVSVRAMIEGKVKDKIRQVRRELK
ncbi:hypothetical protein F4782DRAFT_530504 [Xylaria castorea]|nr:hypothetical protein F4782DRAFT_530504 [Xylaria castorea]